jgi:hypothetical protein
MFVWAQGVAFGENGQSKRGANVYGLCFCNVKQVVVIVLEFELRERYLAILEDFELLTCLGNVVMPVGVNVEGGEVYGLLSGRRRQGQGA